jgi:site-specific recombinase XerD
MVDVEVGFEGPLATWGGTLADWLDERGCASERSARTVRAFARFSAWMSACRLSAADLDEDLVDAYIHAEQQRSGSRTPAAFQYLPVVKRFFAEHGVLVLRGRVSRDRGGLPRLLVGPLSELLVDLVAWLQAEGYSRGTAMSVAETAARLSAWMAEEGRSSSGVDDALLERFVAAQLRGPVPHPSSARRIVAVRRFLIEAGLIVPDEVCPPPAATPAQMCLQAWTHYLQVERGIGSGTVRERQRWARPFLESMAGSDGSVRWTLVDAHGVNQYVAEQGRGYSLSSRRHLVDAMRSLLTWAWATRRLDRRITAAVLRPPPRRSGHLARALEWRQVEAIKAAADIGTPIGLRDYTVVVLIVRLGLRAGEVASLQLDDIDWHRGQLSVCGKNGRVLTVPLPVDVGDALVDYLRRGRPGTASHRTVFLRARAPLQGLSNKGISDIVARLARSAGLGTVHAHRLRHTAATGVLAHGGSLVEARELLGHVRTDTTKIYARTDVSALGALVVSWGRVPGA